MSGTKILGTILVVAGLLGLVYGHFDYTKETHQGQIGPFNFSIAEKETAVIPSWASLAVIVAGVVLLVVAQIAISAVPISRRANSVLKEELVSRIVLALSFFVVTLAAFPSPPWAQTYPARPIRIIVPYPPGGTSDILARSLGEKLTGALGQPVLVENKPGANGNVGAEFVAKSARRRLHVAARRYRSAGDQSERLFDVAVRSGARFRAGNDGRVFAAHPGRQSGRCGQFGAGAGDARQSQAGQDQFRDLRRWRSAAPRGRGIRAAHRREMGVHPVQRRSAGNRRRRRRTGRRHAERNARHLSAGQGRQAQAARGVERPKA